MPYFTPVIYYIKGEMTADTFNNWILDSGPFTICTRTST